MLNLKTINEAIRIVDQNLTLAKGDRYFYFTYDNKVDMFESKMVEGGVFQLNQLDLEEWIEEAQMFVAELFCAEAA